MMAMKKIQIKEGREYLKDLINKGTDPNLQSDLAPFDYYTSVMSKCLDIPAPHFKGISLLFLAALYEDKQAFRELVKRGARLDHHTSTGVSLPVFMLLFCSESMEDLVQEVLSAHPELKSEVVPFNLPRLIREKLNKYGLSTESVSRPHAQAALVKKVQAPEVILSGPGDYNAENSDKENKKSGNLLSINNTLNISMQVLGLFMVAVGCAAIAIAFILLNAAALSIAGLATAGLGKVAILAGAGLFATGTYRKRQEKTHDSLDNSDLEMVL